MKKNIDRRDFLKLAGLFSLGYAIPRVMRPSVLQPSSDQQNVLMVLFDAHSASNISLYGYPRRTTPNIDWLAEKAIVYHNHIASGNFTTSGTASLLTGMLPWTHRALRLYDPILDSLKSNNIFNVFSDYHRLAYTHNPVANVFLKQFFADIDDLTPWEDLLLCKNYFVDKWFKRDLDAALVSWNRAFERREDGDAYSLYLSYLYEYFQKDYEEFSEMFPLGLPGTRNHPYLLEEGIGWLQSVIAASPQPFLGYYHFLPPHDPYHTRSDFHGQFQNDGYFPIEKPEHIFRGERSGEELLKMRINYDEYILYVDSEFGRLYEFLEQGGYLENTWLILTTDHGEIFERGIDRHESEVLYQPLIHIPLLIFQPGQNARTDIFENTGAIDLLPTLSHLTGHEIPTWAEGRVLPPFSEAPFDRDIFATKVEGVDGNGQITKATASITRGNYKLIYYYGYDEKIGGTGEMIELFNLEADSEELVNLYPGEKRIADELFGVLKARVEAGR